MQHQHLEVNLPFVSVHVDGPFYRINTAGNPTNVQSDLLSDHNQFLTAQVGSGRMTSWTGDTTLSIVKVRRLGGFMRIPYWEMYKGTTKSTNLEGSSSSPGKVGSIQLQGPEIPFGKAIRMDQQSTASITTSCEGSTPACVRSSQKLEIEVRDRKSVV